MQRGPEGAEPGTANCKSPLLAAPCTGAGSWKMPMDWFGCTRTHGLNGLPSGVAHLQPPRPISMLAQARNPADSLDQCMAATGPMVA